MRPESLFSTPLLWQDQNSWSLRYTPQFTARRLAVRGIILDTPHTEQRGKLKLPLAIVIRLFRMIEHNLTIELSRTTLENMLQYISYETISSFVYEDLGFFLMDNTDKQCSRYMIDNIMMGHLRMLWSRENKGG